MNQNERLDYLVEQFKEDSVQYRDLETPADPAGKKRILRSLMNIRMPRMMAPSVIAVQDEYLQERRLLLHFHRSLSFPQQEGCRNRGAYRDGLAESASPGDGKSDLQCF